MGAIPAHSTIDPTGKFLLIANYIGANFVVIPIRAADGGLTNDATVFPVTGKGPNTARQEAPHPHEILFDPAGKFVFGPDLGTDKVWSWTLDAGTLVANPNLAAEQVASGSGPRHMSFHPSGKFVYVIDEMVSSITAFQLRRQALARSSGFRRSRPCRTTSPVKARPPRSSSTPAASGSTARTAATTASSASASTRRLAC